MNIIAKQLHIIIAIVALAFYLSPSVTEMGKWGQPPFILNMANVRVQIFDSMEDYLLQS